MLRYQLFFMTVDRQTDRQTDRHRQTDIHRQTQTDRQTDRQRQTETDRNNGICAFEEHEKGLRNCQVDITPVNENGIWHLPTKPMKRLFGSSSPFVRMIS